MHIIIVVGSTNSLIGTICEINGTTITKKAEAEIEYINNSMPKISAVALTNNRVFIAYNYGSSNTLRSIVCALGTEVINPSQCTILNTSTNSGYEISAVKLSESKVFIAHQSGTSGLNGMLCTISYSVSGFITTVEADTQISSNHARSVSAIELSSSKVFIAHGCFKSSSNYDLYGVVCSVSSSTVSHGVDTVLIAGNNSGNVISVAKVSTNKVLIVHSYGDESNGIECSISGTTITSEGDVLLLDTNNSSPKISAIALATNKIFIAYSYLRLYYLHALVYGGSHKETKVKQLENSTEKIFGIAENTGTEGTKVNIYTPNI